MNKILYVILFTSFISCKIEDIKEPLSNKIVELVVNSSADLTFEPNNFTDFNTKVDYENENISTLIIFNNNSKYEFIIADSLIKECFLTTNSSVKLFKFSYSYYESVNSFKFINIRVYSNIESTFEKEYKIQFDGFREIIENINDPNDFYSIIFDQQNRIVALETDSSSLQFTYDNGNLVQLKVNHQYTIELSYDDKKNPFNSISFRNLNDVFNYINIITSNEDLLYTSYNIFSNENNLTRINKGDYPGDEIKDNSYNYEYRQDDLPLLKKDNKNSYIVDYIYE